MWHVYMLSCADDTFYIGSTNDLARRLKQHNEAKAGARYTRSRRPVRVVYSERKRTRSSALVREAALKKLSRAEKLALLKKEESAV